MQPVYSFLATIVLDHCRGGDGALQQPGGAGAQHGELQEHRPLHTSQYIFLYLVSTPASQQQGPEWNQSQHCTMFELELLLNPGPAALLQCCSVLWSFVLWRCERVVGRKYYKCSNGEPSLQVRCPPLYCYD